MVAKSSLVFTSLGCLLVVLSACADGSDGLIIPTDKSSVSSHAGAAGTQAVGGAAGTQGVAGTGGVQETAGAGGTTGLAGSAQSGGSGGSLPNDAGTQVDPPTGCFADTVAAAASIVAADLESAKKLPEAVSACGEQRSLASFLELSVSALVEIQDGTKNPLEPKEFQPPTSPQDNIKKGDVPKSEYLDLAGRVKKYMSANGRAPNYASNTSLGSQMGYSNLVLLFVKALDYYRAQGKLPDSVALDPGWNLETAEDFIRPTTTYVNDTTDYGTVWVADSSQRHCGEDVDGGDAGREVRSVAAGVVKYVRDNGDGWMYGVVVEHSLKNGDKLTSVYWHLASQEVSEGQAVTKGQRLGQIANLTVSNPHLHFGIRLAPYDQNLSPEGALAHAVFPEKFVDPTEFVDSH